MTCAVHFPCYAVAFDLGGNKRGLPRQLLNILIVWALTGLWHGANWTFLLWGLYYALFLVIEKLFLLKFLQKNGFLGHIYTVLVAVFGWMIFQLNTVPDVAAYWRAMVGLTDAGLFCPGDLFLLRSYFVVGIAAVIGATPLMKNLYGRLPAKARGFITPLLVLLVLVVSTAYLVDATYNPFLYFRF